MFFIFHSKKMILKIVLVLAFVFIAQGQEESESIGYLMTLSKSGYQNSLGSSYIHVCINGIKSDYEKAVQNFIGALVVFSCETEEMLKKNQDTETPTLKEIVDPLACSVATYPVMSGDLSKAKEIREKTIKVINDYDEKISALLKKFAEGEESVKDYDEKEKAEKASQKYSKIREETMKEFSNINTKFLKCFFMRGKTQ